MAGSLDTSTCVLSEGVHDLEPHQSRGPQGGGLYVSTSAGFGCQDVEASPGPTGMDGSHVLGPQPSKKKPLE